MRYEQTKKLSNREFKRLVGVQRLTFDQMVKVMGDTTETKLSPWLSSQARFRRPSFDLLTVLARSRRRSASGEYHTYFHIAQDWQVSESTVCRIVHRIENILVGSGKFRLGGKKSLLIPSQKPSTVVMDVTESPIERPLHGQKRFYSGKQKEHTLKSQLVIDLAPHFSLFL